MELNFFRWFFFNFIFILITNIFSFIAFLVLLLQHSFLTVFILAFSFNYSFLLFVAYDINGFGFFYFILSSRLVFRLALITWYLLRFFLIIIKNNFIICSICLQTWWQVISLMHIITSFVIYFTFSSTRLFLIFS